MKHITTDKFWADRCRPVQCIKNDPLTEIDIHGDCFLLLFLTAGTATFSCGDERFAATAPCFVCFDELDAPTLLEQKELQNYAIYFHPTYLNVNMTLDRMRTDEYIEIACAYDLFFCQPFLDHCRYISIPFHYVPKIQSSCENMIAELQEQRDEYWSCRGRAAFIEILILLERLCAVQTEISEGIDKQTLVLYHAALENAVRFIEANFGRSITSRDIVNASGMDPTTFSKWFKKEYGMTANKYLMAFRIEIAKKQVAFTSVPLKEIAFHCGFKTVQHFTRVFKDQVGETPASYRKRTLEERMEYFNN